MTLRLLHLQKAKHPPVDPVFPGVFSIWRPEIIWPKKMKDLGIDAFQLRKCSGNLNANHYEGLYNRLSIEKGAFSEK
jgi:hypothetical protein